ncbi:MAG: DUF4142 domain-containing protein [Bacteroidota bacterium]
MKNSVLAIFGLSFLLLFSSCASNGTDSKKEAEKINEAKVDRARSADTVPETHNAMADLKPDADFAVSAADGGMLEVQLGQLAKKNGASGIIKSLGDMMERDHNVANKELKKSANDKNITLPDALSAKSQKKVQELTSKKGTEFDNAYVDLMISDLKDAIEDFRKEGASGNDTQISAWAKDKIPTLEHHLMMAEQAKKAIDKKD